MSLWKFAPIILFCTLSIIIRPAQAANLGDVLSVLDQGSRTLNSITYGSGCTYKKGVQRLNCQVQDASYKIKRAEQLSEKVFGSTAARNSSSARRAPSDRIITKADAIYYYQCSKADRSACSEIALTPTRALWALQDNAARIGAVSPEAFVQSIMSN